MFKLLTASVIWGISFGLIGNLLADLSPAIVATTRLMFSLLTLLPFTLRRNFDPLPALLLLALGALQFGVMYLFYIASFQFLPSHVVALFTILTPVHVALLSALPRFNRATLQALVAALLAAGGAAVVYWERPGADRLWYGFLLVQASNFSFAAGQLLYRRFMRRRRQIVNSQAIIWMYAGGVAFTLPFALIEYRRVGFAPTMQQGVILVYLGVVASGIGFWLWNSGARSVGRSATLAVMNNAKIPLGMIFSLLIFREEVMPGRLAIATAALVTAVALTYLPLRRR